MDGVYLLEVSLHKNEDVKNVNNVYYLGVNADCMLNFCEHYCNVTRLRVNAINN